MSLPTVTEEVPDRATLAIRFPSRKGRGGRVPSISTRADRGSGRGRPKFTHYGRIGHPKYTCYNIHGFSPQGVPQLRYTAHAAAVGEPRELQLPSLLINIPAFDSIRQLWHVRL